MKSLFIKEGNYYIPTDSAASPWGPTTMHGGASTSLMAAVMEEHFSSTEMQLARLTVDLFRSVPMLPLRVECLAVREGKRVKVFDVSVYHQDTKVCRASGLVLHKHTIDVPERITSGPGLPTALERAMRKKPTTGVENVMYMGDIKLSPGLHSLLELKPVYLELDVGYGCSWIKVPLNVIEGQAISPLLRVASVIDFANAFSQVHLGDGLGFINADLSVNLFRMPVDDWLCIEANAYPQTTGLSMVDATLYDKAGAVGRINQACMTMPRFNAP
jgi:hypothetical protein